MPGFCGARLWQTAVPGDGPTLQMSEPEASIPCCTASGRAFTVDTAWEARVCMPVQPQRTGIAGRRAWPLQHQLGAVDSGSVGTPFHPRVIAVGRFGHLARCRCVAPSEV